MIKEIRYGGITTTPSDYECPDGDLRASYNLINEDGALTPVMPPAIVHANLQGKRLLCVHANTSPIYTNVILQGEGQDGKLYYIEYRGQGGEHNLYTIPEGETLVTIQTIGNTLVIFTDKQTLYFLWKDGDYVNLGTMPEFELRFTNVYKELKEYMVKGINVNPITAMLSNNLDEYTIAEEDQDDITNAILAAANKAIAEATEDKCFVMPYFVRYSFRMYDGTTTRASAPILMLPTTLAPFLVKYYYTQHQAPVNNAVIKCSRYKLAYFCDSQQLQALQLWKDIISCVDIFVSEPIWNYDQSGKCKKVYNENHYKYSGNVINTDFLHYASAKVTPMISTYMSIDSTSYYELPQFDRPLSERVKEVQNFYLFKSIPLEELESPEASTDEEESDYGRDTFYKPVIIEGNLQALSSRETLPDDYDSHDTITAASAFTFNARLTLANITKTLFKGFSPLCCFNAVTNDFSRPTPTTPRYFRVKAYTFIKTEEGEKVVCKDLTHDVDMQLNDAFPRWYYYPNMQAYRTIWVVLRDINYSTNAERAKTIDVYDLQMRSHEYLNGAYYCALTKAEQPSTVYTNTFTTAEEALAAFNNPTSIAYISTAISGKTDATVTHPNKTYTSEVNNPFSFPLTSINTIGTGTILGLATTTTALSQGQFGQFPLYAFTTDGVWALQTANNGAFIAVQPISRDVCVNADSITQTDNAVLFATDRGIMLLSGSQTACISESLEDDAAGISGMLGIDRLMYMCGITLDDTPFMQYIEGARMIYDYVNQRIVLYNPACQYSYIFSLKTKKWGMMAGQFLTHANAYPEVVVQDNDYNLVDLSPTTPQTGTVKGLLITRPLKLDGADVLKTVNTVLQRGYFDIHAVDRRPIQQVIWGSRDLLRWHLLSTSNEWYMRGFRGTPYKYFVISIALDLARNEKLMGATIQHEPRYINHPR